MTNTYEPGELPQTTLRQPSEARPTTGTNTLAHPGATRPVQRLEKDLSTSTGHRQGTAATPTRRSSQQMLTAICDPDQRATDRGLHLVAGCVPAGQPMPDPERPRTKFRTFLDAAGDYLDEQPSERTARAAGLRLQHALTGLINETAGRKAC